MTKEKLLEKWKCLFSPRYLKDNFESDLDKVIEQRERETAVNYHQHRTGEAYKCFRNKSGEHKMFEAWKSQH